MTTPNFMPGRRVKFSRSLGGNPETWQFLGIVTTRELDQTKEYADTTAPDDASPLSVPWRKSVVTGRTWAMNFSGMLDSAKLALFQADMDSEDPTRYQFELDPEVAGGGGAYAGPVHFENLKLTGDFKGMVGFTVVARGDDKLTFTAAP